MLVFGKDGVDFTVIDSKTGFRINIERGAAKALARFLCVELNIKELVTTEGLKVHETDAEFRRLFNARWGINAEHTSDHDESKEPGPVPTENGVDGGNRG